MSIYKALVFKDIGAIKAHEFVGNAHSDMPAFMGIYAFIENKSNSVPDRANALRHMAVDGMGFDGADAGDGISDESYVEEYMKSRADE